MSAVVAPGDCGFLQGWTPMHAVVWAWLDPEQKRMADFVFDAGHCLVLSVVDVGHAWGEVALVLSGGMLGWVPSSTVKKIVDDI